MATTHKNISASDLIAKFKYALDNKFGYIMNRAGIMWTQALQNELNRTTSSNLANSRKYGAQWIGHYVADCSGLFYWAFKQLGSYMYHGSNTMWDKYCVSQGKLSNGKRADGKELKPGTAVFVLKGSSDRSHVGLYIGNGEVIEAMGAKNGVVKSKVSESKWKEWGELKYVTFGGSSGSSSSSSNSSSSSSSSSSSTSTKNKYSKALYPTIRRGDKGELVTQLQLLLAKDGSSLQIDGIFGPGTQSAVRAFQQRHGLEVDGIVGKQTWTALLNLV